MTKIISIDMDGTLLNDEKILSANNKIFLKNLKEKGYILVISSGRPVSGLVKYFKDIDVKIDYLVANNGATFYNGSDKSKIFERLLGYDDAIILNDMIIKHRLNIHYLSDKQIISMNKTVGIYMSLDAVLVNLEIHFKTKEELKDFKILKAVISGSEEQLNDFQEKLDREILLKNRFTRSGENYIEVTSNDASKGEALKEIASLHGVKLVDTVAIGDQTNDISMFEVAGKSIAMKNAPDKVKKYATNVGPNNNTGLIELLDQL